MPDEEAVPTTTEPAGESPSPVILPSREAFPPPPEISFTRPLLKAKPSAAKDSVSAPLSSSLKGAGRVGAGLSAGVTFGASIIAGFLIGEWVDNHWIHSAFPWGMLIFTILGVIVGFMNLIRLSSATHRDQD